MNILVTGGAGYLGSVLVPRLVAARHRVAVLDYSPYGPHYPAGNDGTIIADIATVVFAGSLNLARTDAIVHLAAMRLEECEANPAEAFRVNTEGTRRVLQAAERAGVKRFIFASTCSNYGLIDGIATEDTPLSPTTIYAMTKTYAEEFVRRSPIGVVLRFGTLYGPSPHMRMDTLVNALAQAVATGSPFALRDPGSWRPFLHVEDAAAAIAKTLAAPSLVHNAYNVVATDARKRDLHEMVAWHYPAANVTLLDGHDARSYRVLSLRFQQELRWYPAHTLSRSFPQLVEHIREVEHAKETHLHRPADVQP